MLRKLAEGLAITHNVSMFTDADAHLYVSHYTTAEVFLTHILPTMKIRMSSFAQVNDPRESRGWLCGLSVPDKLMDREWDIVALSTRFTDYMKKNAKLLCLTRDDPEFELNPANHLYGRSYAHPSMWDRYASNHSGVCLMFDWDKLGTAVLTSADGRGETYRIAVSYDDIPPGEHAAYHLNASEIVEHGEETVFRDHQLSHHGTLYFRKSRDWASEFEYRWVVLDTQDTDIFVDISDCLAGVVFGDAFAPHAIPMVANVLAEKQIHLAQIKYRNGHPVVLPTIVS